MSTPAFRIPKSCKTSQVEHGNASGVMLTIPANAISAGRLEGFSFPGMQAWMALERTGYYWCRSTNGKTFRETDQIQLLLIQKEDGRCVLLLPSISGDLRAYLKMEGGKLALAWEGDAPGAVASDSELLLILEGKSPNKLVADGVRILRERLNTFRLREEKHTPEFIDYLGWCTWDAFYHTVDADKVIQGLESFKGKVRPGFVILDDGWLDKDENEYLNSFRPNPRKFPDGFAPLIKKAKEEYGVKLFGIWHAFEGYWRGVKADGELGKSFRTLKNVGDIRPWAPKVVDLSLLHPDDAPRFFQQWHDYLRSQGADFVKVDGQSALEVFTKGILGRVSTMRAYQYAYQGAIQTHFKGNAISCMSNGSDVAYNLLAANVWRNSQDFFPKDPTSHGKHILWNAMNAMWSANFCYPDWDMFWSSNPEGEFHAMARAISGGPVYISDKPESHDFNILERLVTSDGKVLRSDRPALPADDCIFVDALRENRLVKLTNHTGQIGVIGLFNCRNENVTVTDSFSPADVPEIAGQKFAVYLHKAGTLQVVSRKQNIKITLGHLGAEIATISPIGGWIAPIGLIGKYNPAAGVISCELTDEDECVATVRDGGTIAFWCEKQPQMVAASEKSKISFEDGLLTIRTKPGKNVRIQITR